MKTNSSDKIPTYEILQNNNKVDVFFNPQLAEKINNFLKETKVPLITVSVPEHSLLLSPFDNEESCINLFNDWMAKTFK